MIDVTAAALIDGDKLFIAKRPVGDPLAGKWELPGGKIDPGESPEECLVREMQEEFGIRIAVEDCFGESVYEYDHISIRLIGYRVSWVDGAISSVAHDEFRWASLKDLDRYDFAPADIPLIKKIRSTYGL